VIAAALASLTATAATAQNPTPPASAAPSDDGQWTMPAKNYASTRFSELDQITSENAQGLQMAWSFDLGVDRGQEAAPIVVDDMMYVVTAYPNVVFAFDLNQPGTPKWKYEPTPVPAAQGVACCDVVNRGGVVSEGKFIFNTLDGRTIALNTETGEEEWVTQLADISIGETLTMAPLVVKDKVLVGNSGGEFGIRGWLTAVDLNTGEQAWRAYHVGPDEDVLIGDDFKPFYEMDRGENLGVTTWPTDAWKIGGGPAWGWISYDPDLDLIYYGTGNPGPWNAEQRPGDNKWTAGIFARDPDDGSARWFYQLTPHDVHDYDGINEVVLLDMEVDGAMRKVLVRPERNGFLYVIDRETGEVLSADAYSYVNSATGVDLSTGRLQVNPEKVPTTERVTRDICPTASGSKDWNPSAYSPETGDLYIPNQNICMDWRNLEVSYIAGTPYVGAEVVMKPGPGGHRGELTAWNVAGREAEWEIHENFPVWSGVLATAGDLVFYGTMDNWFKAVDARDGSLKWQFETDSGIIGQPITYQGPDGRQYVAVLSGVGGWAGAIVAGNLDPRDPTAALGFVGAMPDLKEATQAGGTLYVFALPE
jgi:PQQ-dependent dehydrogenase (methanol/ethanol family)